MTIARTKPQEPRWASIEEVDRRRQEKLCLRCADLNHRVRHCRTKLSQKESRTKLLQAAAVAGKKKKEEELVDQLKDTFDSDENSGKE